MDPHFGAAISARLHFGASNPAPPSGGPSIEPAGIRGGALEIPMTLEIQTTLEIPAYVRYIEVRDTVQIISATTVVFAGLLKNPNLETVCPIFNLGF